MGFKLYELTEMYENIWDLIGDDEVDLDALEVALTSIEDNIETKAESMAKLIKGIDGDIATLKEEEQRLAKKRRTRSINFQFLLSLLSLIGLNSSLS